MMSKHEILKILVEQLELLRTGSVIRKVELTHFREAIQLANFPEVVEWIRVQLNCGLFSTLEEIESLEQNCADGNWSDLIVQCCMILHLAMDHTHTVDQRTWLFRRSTLFDRCRDLSEIAHLRFRLRFVEPESDLHLIIESDMMKAVTLRVMGCTPSLLEMLLVLREAGSDIMFPLFVKFSDSLKEIEIPKLAATLLLSLVSSAIQGRDCPCGEAVVKRLLELGASPMITPADHPSLFSALNRSVFKVEKQPWWLDSEGSEHTIARRGPTALRRLLTNRLSQEVKLALERASCCNLDAREACNKVFPKKLPSLKCIAARYIRESELAILPPRLKFATSKHVASLR